MKGFLYGQSEYNLLNNSIHLSDYIQTAKTHSFTFLSITDSNLYGSYKFYQQCLFNGIKPIIGLEMTYLDDDSHQSKLLAYALNSDGYKNLLKLSTYLSTNEEPFGLEFIKPYRAGIAFIAVYNESIIERLHYSHATKELEEKLLQLNSYMNFYVGYSYTNRLDRLNANQEIKQIANALDIKTLPLHNCRYLTQEDIIIYESLTQINSKPVHIKDYEDYSFDIEPLESKEIDEFVNQIQLELYPKQFYLPAYPNTKGDSAIAYLTSLCSKGLYRRLKGRITKEYHERLNYELSIIDRMGYSDYFLIVWDFILYAKKRNILVGPGRGSGAGSLVSYCLGITEIDPLKYDLLFERFLNPERISMPDIDTDFPDVFRDEVIQYVNQLYGPKHVCCISAFNTFQIKSSIRDLGRIRKMNSSRLNEIIRMVESSSDYDELLRNFTTRPDIYEFLYIIRGLDGLPRHISTHAAGIIISSTPLDDVIPLQEGVNGLYQSQLEAVDLEKIGLLKMDFLGIRNLTIIDEIMKNIPGFTMEELRSIPLDDKKTYQLLQNADTLGVFQLESDGIRRVLNKLKPERFDDLVAVLALYRPGPMDNIDEFIARRHGKKFTYEHPVLEPILKSTYGIIVYQEQIMQIAQKFANFSLGQADLLRRAISKKNEDQLKEQQSAFIEGAMKNGYSKEVANHIYEYFLKFNNYGFNKSHAVAYGLVSYQMAYFKANYFNIFISKILNNVIGATKTMVGYINYAKTHQVVTFKPNVNISTNRFEVTTNGMFMPLQSIHSIGEATTTDIVCERNKNGLYKSFKDFKERTNLSESCLEALIFSGALDGFGMSKKQMIDVKDSVSEIISRHLEDRIEDQSEYDFTYLQQKEAEYLGFNITYDIFKNLAHFQQKYQATYLNKKTGRCVGSFESIKIISTKKQEKMLVGKFYDNLDTIDFVMFPQEYQALTKEIEMGKLYFIEYNSRVDAKTNQNQLIIKNVIEC
ncbi:DNA polymerase III subunit alpha [bacterium]|nr:DNA polymerase III subunit alpha [bacterium]